MVALFVHAVLVGAGVIAVGALAGLAYDAYEYLAERRRGRRVALTQAEARYVADRLIRATGRQAIRNLLAAERYARESGTDVIEGTAVEVKPK
jgi:uncharacterized membrane protein YebE (DUF533 family)